jgi:hypothetical protein
LRQQDPIWENNYEPGKGRGVRGGGGAITGGWGGPLSVALARTTVQDEATMLRTAGSKAGDSGAPDAGEDGAVAVEPRRPG